jgi:predicted anti-sigma-YlaC factor YlaD
MAGNFPAARSDLSHMTDDASRRQLRCTTAREALSAMHDGEPVPDVAAEDLRDHLVGCPGCTRWQAQTVRMDRLLRVSVAPDDGPDLVDSVLAEVRLPVRSRWQHALRIALAVVALVQVTIGLANLFGTVGLAMAVPTSPHMDHEEAAFDVAFGVVMAMVAWNSKRARDGVPVLATVVCMLAISSVFDLLNGEVSWSRLATHTPILVGLLLTVALGRSSRAGDGPVGRTAPVPVADPTDMAVPDDPGVVRVWPQRGQPAPPAAHREIA